MLALGRRAALGADERVAGRTVELDVLDAVLNGRLLAWRRQLVAHRAQLGCLRHQSPLPTRSPCR